MTRGATSRSIHSSLIRSVTYGADATLTVRLQSGTEVTLRAKKQDQAQTGHHRRDGERQVNQRD